MATIMVVISHLYMSGIALSDPIRRLTGLGSSGVELFLFLSGFGLWKSFDNATNGTFHCNSKRLLSWYKRRYLRILIPYLLFSMPMYGILTMMDHQGVGEYLMRVSTFAVWLRHGWGLWYIAMLIPLYFVTPFLLKLLTGKRGIVWLVVLILMTQLVVFFKMCGPEDLYHIRFVIQRLPGFFIGIYLARAICNGEREPLWTVLFIPIIIYASLYIYNHCVEERFFYLWLLILPFSTVGVWLMKCCEWLRRVCEFVGTMSLEVYCTHMFIPVFIMRVLGVASSLWIYILGVCVSIILSWGINKAAKRIIELLR